MGANPTAVGSTSTCQHNGVAGPRLGHARRPPILGGPAQGSDAIAGPAQDLGALGATFRHWFVVKLCHSSSPVRPLVVPRRHSLHPSSPPVVAGVNPLSEPLSNLYPSSQPILLATSISLSRRVCISPPCLPPHTAGTSLIAGRRGRTPLSLSLTHSLTHSLTLSLTLTLSLSAHCSLSHTHSLSLSLSVALPTAHSPPLDTCEAHWGVTPLSAHPPPCAALTPTNPPPYAAMTSTRPSPHRSSPPNLHTLCQHANEPE